MSGIYGFDSLHLPSVQEVRNFLEKRHQKYDELLKDVEEKIVAYRDKPWDWGGERGRKNIPIYLTKFRIKSAESLYLKLKRKARKDVNSNTDLGGIRALVLFDSEIPEVLEYILLLIAGKKFKEIYKLEEIVSYNIPEDLHFTIESSEAWKNFSASYTIERGEKKSGYRSFHLLLSTQQDGEKYTIEVQLRNVLQDVWSEMEHILAYKQGKDNEGITVGFHHLQEDIGTMERRLRHLVEVRKEHNSLQILSMRRSKPAEYFWYEEELIPKVFNSDDDLQQGTQTFREKSLSPGAHDIESSIEKCNSIADSALALEKNDEERQKIEYWRYMEIGYILFIGAEYQQALDVYKKVPASLQNNPVWNFRQAEICFRLEKDIEAHEHFDNCLVNIKSKIKACSSSTQCRIMLIKMLISIASTYEFLGAGEYDLYSINLFKIALQIEKNLGTDRDRNRALNITNNLCWCFLSRFVESKSDKDKKIFHADAYEHFQELEKRCKEQSVLSSNFCDTMAWFSFNTFLAFNKHDRPEDVLCSECYSHYSANPQRLYEKARQWAQIMPDLGNNAVFRASSVLAQTRRIQKIMAYNMHASA